MKKRKKAPDGAGNISNSGYMRRTINGKIDFDHRRIAEKILKRELKGQECIHHINGCKLDNRAENLVICPDYKYHKLLHQREDALRNSGNANYRKCNYCGQYDNPDNLYINQRSCRHRECHNEYRRNKNVICK